MGSPGIIHDPWISIDIHEIYMDIHGYPMDIDGYSWISMEIPWISHGYPYISTNQAFGKPGIVGFPIPILFEGVCVNYRHPGPRRGEPRVCSAQLDAFPLDRSGSEWIRFRTPGTLKMSYSIVNPQFFLPENGVPFIMNYNELS